MGGSSWKNLDGHRYELGELLAQAESMGGSDEVRCQFNKYNTISKQRKESEDSHAPQLDDELAGLREAWSLHSKIRNKRGAVKRLEAVSDGPKVKSMDQFEGCKPLRYCPETNLAQIDGNDIDLATHPFTTERSGDKQPRKRLQLTQEAVESLHAPVIDEHSGEVEKIIFPNGKVNAVIQARRDTKCIALRELHHFLVDGEGKEIDTLLDKLPNSCWDRDKIGGGRYHAVGFGTLGRPRGCPKGKAFLRVTACNPDSFKISALLGRALALMT